MGLSTISDLHIKVPGDRGHILLKKFLAHPQVRSSDHIALLGDIFDLWVGDISHKYEDFKDVFDDLALLSKEGKTIYYFEGNHDLHLRNLERRVPGIQYIRDYILIGLRGRDVLLSHGDWFDDQDRFYYRYRRIIGSKKLAKIILGLVGEYNIIRIGNYASRLSRSRNTKRYSEHSNESVRDKFRLLAQECSARLGVGTIVWGHSHVRDIYQEEKLVYINNGYGPIEGVFNYIPSTGDVFQISLV